ncbi:helix-turn-helix domain-containing protein [Maricaulis maris]
MIGQRRAAGETVAAIAASFGISGRTVSKWLA